MSGYISGILAILLINIVIAYSVYLPASAGLLNLGAAGFVLIGGYMAGEFTQFHKLPLAAAIPIGGLIAGAIGFLVSFPILRTRGVYMVLATFAFAEVVGGIFLNIPRYGEAAGFNINAYAGLSIVLPTTLIVIAFVAWLLSTRFGLAMRSVHDDENVAMLFGVDLRATQVAAFTLGGFLGGVGGALLAHQFQYIDVQNTGVLFSIYVLLYVLMGGTQTAFGPIAGAAFFTIVPELLRGVSKYSASLKFLEDGRFIVFGIAVVLVMVLRPEGLITRTMTERLYGVFRRAPKQPAGQAGAP